jgi:uncharacterized protein
LLRLVVACAALGAAAGCGKAHDNAARPNPSWCQRDYPALTGRVVDKANLLTDAEEQAMTAQLAAIEAKTAHQIVVATVPTTGGKDIVEYTTCLGRHWGIGRAKIDDGVVVLVARNDGTARIAVGYGLEKALTDPEAQAIMTRDMVPAFEKADFAAGLSRGITAIGSEIGATR